MGEMDKQMLGFLGKREEEGRAIPEEPKCKPGHQRYRRHGLGSCGLSLLHTHTHSPQLPTSLAVKEAQVSATWAVEKLHWEPWPVILAPSPAKAEDTKDQGEIRTNDRKSLDSQIATCETIYRMRGPEVPLHI